MSSSTGGVVLRHIGPRGVQKQIGYRWPLICDSGRFCSGSGASTDAGRTVKHCVHSKDRPALGERVLGQVIGEKLESILH
jgi:hypothetical protein